MDRGRTAAPTYRREWMGRKIEALEAKMAEYDARILAAAKLSTITKVEAWLAEVSTDAGVRTVQRRVRAIIAEAQSYVRDWARQNLPEAYKIGLEVTKTQLREQGIKTGKLGASHLNAAAINFGVEQLNGDMATALGSIGQKLNRLYREMHVALKQAAATKRQLDPQALEKMATKDVVQAVVSGEGYLPATRRMFDSFKEEIGSGLVRITGPSGVTRNYDLKGYTRMVARTRLRETVVQGTKNSLIENGFDFVQVSAYGTDCPVCGEYEDSIYSLSGQGELDNPDFQGALTDEDEPPFHPNCTHTLVPYVPDPSEVIGDPTGTFPTDEEAAAEAAVQDEGDQVGG